MVELARRRWVAAVLVVMGGACLLTLLTKGTSPDPSSAPGALYPSPAWGFALVLVLAGVLLLFRRSAAVMALYATSAALVAALQLVGLGVVAFKHWPPYIGMSGVGSNVGELRVLALVLAGAATVATVGCAWLLRSSFPVWQGRAVRVVAVVVGTLLVGGVPLMVGSGDPENMDVNSLGAYLLLYGLPWGVCVVACGWLDRRTGTAVAEAVLLSVFLVASTEPMPDIVFSDPRRVFLLAFAAVLVVVVVLYKVPTGQKVQQLRA